MTPVTFNECFGWLHAPANGAGSEIAVLICQGLMRDAVLPHCSMRLLADELAAAGYCTLRFDYPGTGDSCDGDIDAAGGHWSVWQRSISTAADWLRATSGARQLILCGFRAGATLAALAATRRDDVAGLLLFEPVVSGHSYVRELILEADLQSGQSSPRSEGLAIREFRFSAATVNEIAATDLRQLELPPGRKVAIFAQGDNRMIDACVRAWLERRVDTVRYGWFGLEPMLQHEVLEENPLADFGGVVSWARRAFPLAAPAAPPALGPIAAPQLTPPGCMETPLTFDAGGRLFGVLCRPDHGTSETVVIIVNGGRDPHYGAARQSVALARRLARSGISSFRMDFAGIGDSVGPPGKENVLTYTFSDREPEIRAAVDLLAGQGFRRFAAQGLCSGAYHAFRGALAEPRITILMLVNIALFHLPNSDVLDYLDQRGRSPLFYMRKLVRRQSWNTLLSDKADLAGAWRDQVGHVRRQVVSKAYGLARRVRVIEERSFADRALDELDKRGVRTLFLFSPGDHEIDAFAREFGRTGAGLEPYDGATMQIVPGMDHDLTRTSGRLSAEAIMVDFAAAAV